MMKKCFSIDLPFVHVVEDADRRNHNAASTLYEENKGNMRMLDANLSTSFHEESLVDKRIAKLEEELANLKKRKRGVREDIHRDITKLL
jgi:hypothetical protein